jgi:hypothetical protein
VIAEEIRLEHGNCGFGMATASRADSSRRYGISIFHQGLDVPTAGHTLSEPGVLIDVLKIPVLR